MQTQTRAKTALNYRRSERQELDVPIASAVAIALPLAIAVYALIAFLGNEYLRGLLFERGFTQYVAIVLACIVAAFSLQKFFKLLLEFDALRYNWLPANIPLGDASSGEVAALQQNLSSSKGLLPQRCSRILAAYIQSGSNRQTAVELGADDSAFYSAASEASYSFPRIVVWSIPLLGFVGTVLGISGAVDGFSGFLETADEIDRIKEGIAQVTTGLAVAFDTTLLALLLSVAVMVPLVLAERLESRLLLAIDVYVNDRLVPRLRDSSYPTSEASIARTRDRGFVGEVESAQDTTVRLLEHVLRSNEDSARDRQQFLAALEWHQDQNRTLFESFLEEMEKNTQILARELHQGNAAISQNLAEQIDMLRAQLEGATQQLDRRISLLDGDASQLEKMRQLQYTLEQNLHALNETGQLQNVLLGVRESLERLNPLISQLGKPRRITLVEKDEL